MKQAKVLTQTEIKRLLRVVSTTKHAARNRLVVMLSYLAGLRACEIASLLVGDVINLVGDSCEVKTEVVLKSSQTKGKKAQTVVLSSQLRKEIADYYQKAMLLVDPTDYLISSQKKSGFSSQTIQNLFRELYQEAGISNASSHSGRRFFVTNLSEKGVSVRVIQELARHSSLATTQRYIDVSVDKLRLAVEAVSI
ncbi:MAG: site-specific integrase [Gammaproteobacteria bacterium]|nr:site-specific integrase [Gammaproteobacteria bacterium]